MKKPLLIVLLLLFISSSAYSVGEKITWTLPTTNADGTPLTDLVGTHIYCDDTMLINVLVPLNTYIVLSTCKDVYVSAYDTSGNESIASNKIDFMPPAGCTNLKRN